MADVLVDREGHALLVVDEVDLGELDEGGRAVAQHKLQLAAAADDLLGRDAVGVSAKARMNSTPPPETMKVFKPLARRWSSISSMGW